MRHRGTGQGEEYAGVGPLLESRASRRQDCGGTEQFPDSEDCGEVRRIPEVRQARHDRRHTQKVCSAGGGKRERAELGGQLVEDLTGSRCRHRVLCRGKGCSAHLLLQSYSLGDINHSRGRADRVPPISPLSEETAKPVHRCPTLA